MDGVTIHVQSLPGDVLLTLVLYKGATCWDLMNALKTLLCVPRRRQRLLLGERVLGTADKLGCSTTGEITLTLIVVEAACSYCRAKHNLRRCSGCNDVYYCGPICQLFDWQRGHELACGGANYPTGDEDESLPVAVLRGADVIASS